MKRLSKLLALSIIFLLVSVSCSKTNLISTWKNRDYEGGYLNSVLLIMVSTDKANRRIFEDVFVRKFKKYDVKAVASTSVFPTEKAIDKDMIRTEAAEQGMDAVFVMYLLSVGEKAIYRPSPTGPSIGSPASSMHGYDFQDIQNYAYDPGYHRRKKFVKFESKLYEIATDKLIWSATSETIEPKSTKDVINHLSKKVMKNLKEHQLIR